MHDPLTMPPPAIDFWNHRFGTPSGADSHMRQNTVNTKAYWQAAGQGLFSQIFRGRSFLEIGCGTGEFARSLIEIGGAETGLGLDLSSKAILVAMRENPAPGLSYLARDTRQVGALEGIQADVAVSCHVIEHYRNPVVFLDTLCACARQFALVVAPYNERDPDGAPLSAIGIEVEDGARRHLSTIDDTVFAGRVLAGKLTFRSPGWALPHDPYAKCGAWLVATSAAAKSNSGE